MSSYNMQDTPFGYTLSVIGGKWKMVIMFVIVEKSVARYGEIKRAIPDITHKMLSAQLKELARRYHPPQRIPAGPAQSRIFPLGKRQIVNACFGGNVQMGQHL